MTTTRPQPTPLSGDPAGLDNQLLVLVGGARSGKSTLAQDLARQIADRRHRPVIFVATATAGDADMAARIARHQTDRPDHWQLVEEPMEVEAAVEGLAPDGIVIIDCLTMWVANLVFAALGDAEIQVTARSLATVLAARAGPTIVVTNEVGMGIHPPSELGRRYQDLLGRVNQLVAGAAGRTLLVAAGRVVELHGADSVLAGWPETHQR